MQDSKNSENAEVLKKPQNQSPAEKQAPQISSPKQVAGGIPAVISSLKHTFSEMGIIRGSQTLLKANQKKGFDCPGCAWPDPDDRRAMTEFCENGAKAIAEEGTIKRVTPEFFHENSILDLAKNSDFWLGKQGRLTDPMLKRPGATHYEEVGWNEAFQMIADQLNSLASPHEATFYTSGRTSNEAAFLYQLFVRIFGTNNLPDCSNMCHESSGVAMMESIGVGKGTVSLEDFDRADCILIVGQNPGTNHPRMLTALQKASLRGAKIISINPLKEAGMTHFKHPQEILRLFGKGTAIAGVFVPVKINGDVALLKGLMKAVVSAEELNPGKGIDFEFIKNYTSGFTEFVADLKATEWNVIVQESGITQQQIEEIAHIIASSERVIACWAMGLTQHKNAVANIQEIINLLLLGGHLGKPGAGACPVRGHSNVQGDRTMGIWEKMPDRFLNQLQKEFNFNPPRAHGLDTVDSIRAMKDGKVKVFVGMGGNFLSATPDTDFVAAAMSTCKLTVQISTKLNRSHLVTGETALILPCLGRTEEDIQLTGPQFVTVENSMGVVHSSRGTLKPGSANLLSEVAIIAGLAQAVFRNTSHSATVNWDQLKDNYHLIRERISRVVEGFENFNEKIVEPAGFHLPHLVRDKKIFNTQNGKANFFYTPYRSAHSSSGTVSYDDHSQS